MNEANHQIIVNPNMSSHEKAPESPNPSFNQQPDILPRSSSKRPLTRSEEDTAEEARKQLEEAGKNVETAQKRIRPTRSFDEEFWGSALSVCDAQFDAANFEKRYQMAVRPGPEERKAWWHTVDAAAILAKMRAATVQKDLYKKQETKIKKSGNFY